MIQLACGFLLLLAITSILFPLIIAVVLNRSPPKSYLDSYFITPFELQIPFENVQFSTSDHLIIRGWWMPGRNKSAVIGCSGKNGTKDDLIGIGTALWRAGHSVLLFDCRDRGESDKAPRTIGYSELLDAAAALDYVGKKRPKAKIGMLGFSMGAALAIMTAAVNSQIEAIVADSSFNSAYELVQQRLRKFHILVFLLMPLVDYWNRKFYKYSLHQISPINEINKIAPAAVLLIHGSKDSVIPASNAKELYKKAVDPKEIWIVDGADHCGAYFADRSTYIKRVVAFFRKTLGC